jgi:hypothetical protein
LSWNAIGQFEDENPGSFEIIWERVKQYARDELESEPIDAKFQAKTIRDYWMTLATERVAVESERMLNVNALTT